MNIWGLNHVPMWAWIFGYGVEAVSLYFGIRALNCWLNKKIDRRISMKMGAQ